MDGVAASWPPGTASYRGGQCSYQAAGTGLGDPAADDPEGDTPEDDPEGEGDRAGGQLVGVGAALVEPERRVTRFPRSAAAASTMAGYISTGQYLWGLRRVLDGMTCGGAASSHGASGKAADVELASDRARPVQAG